MDGASKFVRGDAVAGIFITVVNVIGGILIGFFQRDLLIADALQTYTVLSIGDGLVSQIPAIIIISIAAGILVTRSNDEANLGEFVGKQLTVYPKAVAIAGCLLLLFAFFSPKLFGPFLFSPWPASHWPTTLKRKGTTESSMEEITGNLSPANASSPSSDNNTNSEGLDLQRSDQPTLSPMEQAIEQEVFGLEMGYGLLLVLAEKSKGGDLLDRITGARTNFCS